MISEKQFASSYQSFWKELLPLLTPSFISVFNNASETFIHNIDGSIAPPIVTNHNTRDASVVSVFAYHIAQESTLKSISVENVINDKELCQRIQANAISTVNRYEDNNYFPDALLNSDEITEGTQLAVNYQLFFKNNSANDICFDFKVPGSGLLKACSADLSIDNYLVEVKTINRNISSRDIKQLFIYLALSSANSLNRWKYVGFLNPRRSVYYKIETGNLISNLTGGRPTGDVLLDFLEFIGSSDIQTDSVF